MVILNYIFYLQKCPCFKCPLMHHIIILSWLYMGTACYETVFWRKAHWNKHTGFNSACALSKTSDVTSCELNVNTSRVVQYSTFTFTHHHNQRIILLFPGNNILNPINATFTLLSPQMQCLMTLFRKECPCSVLCHFRVSVFQQSGRVTEWKLSGSTETRTSTSSVIVSR